MYKFYDDKKSLRKYMQFYRNWKNTKKKLCVLHKKYLLITSIKIKKEFFDVFMNERAH